jgi:hypothetical protein
MVRAGLGRTELDHGGNSGLLYYYTVCMYGDIVVPISLYVIGIR